MEANSGTFFEKEYFLGDLVGTKVVYHGRKIGTLTDLIIKENGGHPQIMQLVVGRPFGDKPYVFPVENLRVMTGKEIVVNNIEDLKKFEREPDEKETLLKDYILYKKVLDLEGRDMAVVYDVRIIPVENRLYVSEVDLGKFRYFQRMGFIGYMANFINKVMGRIKEQLVSWDFVEPLSTDLGSFQGELRLKLLKEKFAEMNPIDLADVLEELDPKQRQSVFHGLSSNRAAATLEEIDPYVQRELALSLPKDRLANLISRMTPGQAADLLANIHFRERNELMKLIDSESAKKIQSIIDKQEEKVGDYATAQVIKLPPEEKVGEIKNNYAAIAMNKKVVMYLYIVDTHDNLLGVLDIKELLEAQNEKKLSEVMIKNFVSFKPTDNLKSALKIFDRYDFRAIPVINKNRKLLGVVTYRDIEKLKHTFLE